MESETLTPARLKEDVQLIKEWMSKQPHLPEVEDEEWLIAVIHNNKYSLEKTKRKVDNYFSFRTKYPELLKNRDPTSSDIVQTMNFHKLLLADKLTKDKELIALNIYQPDANAFDVVKAAKLLFMICDTFLLEHERHDHLVLITDCRDLSYIHFLKAFPWLKSMIEIFFNAYSDRMKAFYVMNAPAHLEKVFNTVKGLLPKKIADRFYVYPTMDNICKLVDEDVVSSDWGGKGTSLASLEEYTLKRLAKYREWFLEQDNVCSNEELRRRTDDTIENLQGSFRKLEVD